MHDPVRRTSGNYYSSLLRTLGHSCALLGTLGYSLALLGALGHSLDFGHSWASLGSFAPFWYVDPFWIVKEFFERHCSTGITKSQFISAGHFSALLGFFRLFWALLVWGSFPNTISIFCMTLVDVHEEITMHLCWTLLGTLGHSCALFRSFGPFWYEDSFWIV